MLKVGVYKKRLVRYTKCMKKRITMNQIFKDPRYRGRHIIMVSGKLYTAKTGDEAGKILEKARKEHPRAIPKYTYIPKENILIV